ncbi:hypothetical protein ACFL1N_12375 [Thermodesulfobacteriota bacterium]
MIPYILYPIVLMICLQIISLWVSVPTNATKKGDIAGPTVLCYVCGIVFFLFLLNGKDWHPWSDIQCASLSLCVMVFFLLGFYAKKRKGGLDIPVDGCGWTDSIEKWRRYAYVKASKQLSPLLAIITIYFIFVFQWTIPPFVSLYFKDMNINLIKILSFFLGFGVVIIRGIPLFGMLPKTGSPISKKEWE